ncbi:MAG TPA: hypothetical protein VD772_07930 [Anseongella sp.]|nr:hypothetical protein [Anseongella sp.]
MNRILALLFLLFPVSQALGQSENPNYDPVLAKKLGADDHGMKPYMLVILKTGSNKTSDKTVIDSCFSGHMKNINRLVESGKLIVAGPLGKNDKEYRGIFILNVGTLEEAGELLQTDPAIKENFWIQIYTSGTAPPLYRNTWKLPTKSGRQSPELKGSAVKPGYSIGRRKISSALPHCLSRIHRISF